MTVTYTGKVANAKLWAFSRLLFHWKGSLYKLVYKEMFIFVGLYMTFSLLYRFAMIDWQKRLFERICLYVGAFTNLIPLSFVLGFYVAIVVARWWNQFLSIPWPDRVSLFLVSVIDGIDERSRLLRRTIMRYLMLSSLIVFQATSVSVKKRFPTMEHLIEAGVMTRSEMKALEDVTTPHGKWWVPFVWCANLLRQARNEGKINDDFMHKSVLEEVLTYRGNLGMLYSYDWISIPLVYTQVTTLAVYTFFLGCVFGRQFLDPEQGYPGHELDLYVPVFTLLQFFFYMGWLKVAEQMINPFGEDDDDFDMNWVIDRNMQASYLCVDDLYGTYPKLEKDIYWDESPPEYLPYTLSAISSMKKPHMGSTAELSINNDEMKLVPMETIQEGMALPSHSSTLHMNQMTRQNTPVSSPGLGHRHLHNNVLHSFGDQLKSNLSQSRGTLDGLHVNERPISIPLAKGLDSPVSCPIYSVQGSLKCGATAIDSPKKFPSGQNDMSQDMHKGTETKTLDFKQNIAVNPSPSKFWNFTEFRSKDQKSNVLNAFQSSDVPEIKVQSCMKEEEATNLRPTQSSDSSLSYPEYEQTDSTHSTVTSLTPLLPKEEDKPETIASIV